MWTEQEESTTVWDAHSHHAAQVRAHRQSAPRAIKEYANFIYGLLL
jgi:hypothetical protein